MKTSLQAKLEAELFRSKPQEWQFRRRLLRWCADGFSGALTVPAAAERRLDATTRGTLDRLADACANAAEMGGGSFRLVTTSEPGPAIIELGGPTASVAWAPVNATATSPGPGRATETQLIRGEWARPFAALVGGTVNLDTEAGGLAVVEIDDRIAGPIDGFGVRFWKLVADASPRGMWWGLQYLPRVSSIRSLPSSNKLSLESNSLWSI